MQTTSGEKASFSPWPKTIFAITLFAEDLPATKRFYQEIFGLPAGPETVVLGSAQMLAGQPEFGSSGRIPDLLALAERRDQLEQALSNRRSTGLTITIGGENNDSRLSGFTLVTSSYRSGDLSGVIGVIGPTRMPYDKIIGLVDHTSRLVEGLME